MVEVVHNQEGRYSVTISSTTGNLLFESKPFSSEKEAKASLLKLKKDVVFERKTNTNGKFMINLKTTDGVLIGQSELYSSEAGMENGIKNLQMGIQMP
ncbi:YegP family protein [Croceivirga thetidis]|uniref:YegP family protein n=1 Tax=Croceivirga thetidis TaxID=2721623 RepID=A0ABX1GQD7_9FLAO|nr:YegP family protein [Croceivirga thetidis]NKI32131.1 YegP family protein [Croceivirga thetidis]